MKLGVFGGSFNPIHFGHLVVADTIWNEFELDRILFIPANVSPFKTSEPDSARPDHRLRMVQLAVADHPRFSCSDMELRREGPSYTVDTLEELSADMPKAELFLLMGGDSLAGFHRWKEPDKILQLAQIIVFARTGSKKEDSSFELASRVLRSRTDLTIDVSSTEIRQRISEGASFRYRVPNRVWTYINEHSLYK